MSRPFWLSPLAIEDLEEIAYYVACDNYGAAHDLTDRLFAVFSTLAENPQLGRRREEFRDARSFALRPYVIVYREVPEGIEIIRVLHGARDIDTAMRLQDGE